jgi:hypothetical protein
MVPLRYVWIQVGRLQLYQYYSTSVIAGILPTLSFLTRGSESEPKISVPSAVTSSTVCAEKHSYRKPQEIVLTGVPDPEHYAGSDLDPPIRRPVTAACPWDFMKMWTLIHNRVDRLSQ